MLSRRPKQALFATGCKVRIRRDLFERGGTRRGPDVLVVSYAVAKNNSKGFGSGQAGYGPLPAYKKTPAGVNQRAFLFSQPVSSSGKKSSCDPIDDHVLIIPNSTVQYEDAGRHTPLSEGNMAQ
ncbi:MAG: hypothetical protein OEY86_19780 [Nitrospira sp.]|nr:hypothetical protein [Nitrospira sp.]